MNRCTILVTAALVAAVSIVQAAETRRGPRISDALKTRVGDFDTMLERRSLRILVPPGRTLYFNDKGRERGLTAELARDFEEYLNLKYRRKLGNRPITVFLIPTVRARLISDVAAGIGDIAAGNLSVTEGHLEHVDFVAPPEVGEVQELVLTNRERGAVTSVDELSGQDVYVRESSSYRENLEGINQRLRGQGKPPATIVFVPDMVEDEDLMEMLDAGAINITVVSDWLAKMWAPALPNVIINENAVVSRGGRVGWAYRKNSPLLRAELEEFYYQYEQKRGTIPYRLAQYTKNVKRLQNCTAQKDWKRFEETLTPFRKYGAQYGFDPLMLAAQGFQESKLDQSVRSPVGAVGIMQLMPNTGRSMKVGDITVAEHNIHAGTKYMSTLLGSYFKNVDFDPFNRMLFAFASYNAGPNRIAKLREVAAQRGLNPNVWFDNVEVVVSEKVGRETTTYVRNILKYYVSYKLGLELQQQQRKAREALGPKKS